jgi:hypothetical protein
LGIWDSRGREEISLRELFFRPREKLNAETVETAERSCAQNRPLKVPLG